MKIKPLHKNKAMIIMLGCAIFALFFSLMQGSTILSIKEILQPNSLSHIILFNFRLPRTETAFVTGGLLALAGTLMQALLKNPLADPYILGVSGGAAVGTLIFTLLGSTSFLITLGGWGGSLFVMLLVWRLNQKTMRTSAILLTGVAISSLSTAIISVILILSKNESLRGMLFWLAGDLSDIKSPLFPTFILGIGFILAQLLANQINLLIRGEKSAIALGLSIKHLHSKIYIIASILTATAVSQAGCIGFIGLVTPHIMRLLVGSNHTILIPTTILFGGILITIADTLARSIIAPIELPVGLLITLIGAPCFLLILRHTHNAKQTYS